MVTILNICVISFFLFSLEKISSAQKKNESHGFFFTGFGNRHTKSQITKKIYFYLLFDCVCMRVCVWAKGGGVREGLKEQ